MYCYNFMLDRSKRNSGNYYVLLTYQERILLIPGCPANQIMCPWETFQQIFEKSIKECDYQKICKFKKMHEEFKVPENLQSEKEKIKEQKRKEKRRKKALHE